MWGGVHLPEKFASEVVNLKHKKDIIGEIARLAFQYHHPGSHYLITGPCSTPFCHGMEDYMSPLLNLIPQVLGCQSQTLL